jgi:hypothetical protein
MVFETLCVSTNSVRLITSGKTRMTFLMSATVKGKLLNSGLDAKNIFVNCA